MKQIISRELAEELGISTSTAVGQMVACVVEERKVFFRIYTLKDMITALNAEAEYIGNDRSRLVDWKEEEPVPWTQEDVPSLCWLRRISKERRRALIEAYSSAVLAQGRVITYGELAESYEWSADLKNWKSCTKEQ